jgi:hypothetical protein
LLWYKTRLTVITVFHLFPSTIEILASANALIVAIVEQIIIIFGLIIQFAAVNVLLYLHVLQVSILTLTHALVNAIRSIAFHHLFKVRQAANAKHAKISGVNATKFGVPVNADVSAQKSWPVTNPKFGMKLVAPANDYSAIYCSYFLLALMLV